MPYLFCTFKGTLNTDAQTCNQIAVTHTSGLHLCLLKESGFRDYWLYVSAPFVYSHTDYGETFLVGRYIVISILTYMQFSFPSDFFL